MRPAARLALLAGFVVAAVVAFLVVRPSGEPAPPATSTSRPAPGPRRPPEPSLIRLRAGEPIGGVREIAVRRGRTVAFRVTSDRADEIHVHGYDLIRRVPAGGSVAFRFPARLDGIFEVESHQSHTAIARLRVTP